MYAKILIFTIKLLYNPWIKFKTYYLSQIKIKEFIHPKPEVKNIYITIITTMVVLTIFLVLFSVQNEQKNKIKFIHNSTKQVTDYIESLIEKYDTKFVAFNKLIENRKILDTFSLIALVKQFSMNNFYNLSSMVYFDAKSGYLIGQYGIMVEGKLNQQSVDLLKKNLGHLFILNNITTIGDIQNQQIIVAML